jgi:hypothetical protein
MPHRHKIHDTDPFFSIDPFSRTFKNESNKKITLIQHDHNSERFTFVIPRFIEEHDMIECNEVQVHYINIESGNNKPNQNEDVYEVTDLHIDPDDESKVVCSWLISQNATKYVGSLNFVVRFSCVTNGVTEYAWNTAVYSGISVSSGIFNTNVIVEEYSDILAQWAARIEALEQTDYYTKKEIDEKGFLKERPTETRVFLNDFSYEPNMDASFVKGSAVYIAALRDEQNDLSGKEIAKIEYNFDNGDETKWFDIKDLIQKYPAFPYAINANQSFQYTDTADNNIVCFGVIGFFTAAGNFFITDIENLNQYGFRVTYYTD